ncbi:MAG: conjugal transfer protein TraL [Oscillospiraceae bacterium]|nr:conjugal transfer protein TraL [Oscillospiraceae bacterium]
MDTFVLSIIFIEAFLALWLLKNSGVMDSVNRVVATYGLIILAFYLRTLCFDYQTLDYQDFLSKWVEYYRVNGGVKAFSAPLGNYNIPYMYFLCLFSYLPVNDLYLIKLLSICFDVLLAYSVMMLVGLVRDNNNLKLASFFTVLLLPTVFLNGSLWAQCDSIYAALALLGLWLALDDRPIPSVLCFTLSFGFKLQAVFILPIMAVLLFTKKYKLWHLALFPAFYIALVIPAVIMGKPFVETLTLYASQTGSIGSGLNYNSPSIFALFRYVQDEAAASTAGIIAAFAFMFAVLGLCFVKRKAMGDKQIIIAAALLSLGIPFLLPHMHDRYFFLADVMTVVLAFIYFPWAIPVAVLTQFASILGYHAYLKMRWLLTMNYGAIALILVLLALVSLFVKELFLPQLKLEKNK